MTLMRNRKWLAAFITLLCMSQQLLATILSIPFYSQRDSKWSAQKLGTCTNTIGSHGCAVTCASMLLKFRGAGVDPAQLNSFLTRNSGYSNGCLIRWDVAARYSGVQWMRYQGAGRLPDLKTLSKELDSGKYIIAESKRFSNHFVVIRGVTPDGTVGYYWDPWDASATQRRIGDGYVNVGAGTRVFQKQ